MQISHISRGQGDLGRIYDRLRKRSARSHSKTDSWGDSLIIDDTVTSLPNWKNDEVWAAADHAAYVAGVRAALQAVSVVLDERDLEMSIAAVRGG